MAVLGGATETGDIANFRGQGQGEITLAGTIVNPGAVNVSNGSYTFTGIGLAGGAFRVTNGASLTFANSAANTFAGLDIGTGSTVNASHTDSLGVGGVSDVLEL